jgi:two-component system sensor histidine kinase/response regulator
VTRKTSLYTLVFTCLFGSFFLPLCLSAQKAQQLADQKRVDSLNALAFQVKRFDVPQALNHLSVAQHLAVMSNYQKGLGTSYLHEAGIFYQNGYDKKALSTYYKALQLFKTLKDTFNMAFASQQIGLSLQQDGKPGEALQLYNESLRVYKALNRKEDIVNVMNAIGLAKLSMSMLEEAEKQFTGAAAMAQQMGYMYGEKKAAYNMGLLKAQRQEWVAAKSYFDTSLALDLQMKDHFGAALNQLEISKLFLKQKMIDSATRFTRDAYNHAYLISATNLLKEAAEQMIDIYRRQNDKGRASQWQDSLLQVLKTQIENEKAYALNFIEVIKSQDLQKINAEKEVSSARRIQQEQLLVITIGTFILIIVAVLAVLALVNYQRQRFFGRELKQKNEIIERNSAALDQLNKEISNQNLLLEEDNRTKNKLLSIISHDLRTPLVNTKGILNLVNQGMVPDDEADHLLQQLETQYIGTTSLLDNLLFWIKGQMNGQQNDKVNVNLYLLIKALEDEQRLPLQKKHIELRNHIDKSINIVAEKEMMRIVCRNLISNAIKFTNEGGFIALDSRIEGDTLYLSVTDSGIGMTAEAIDKVNAKMYYNTTGTSYEKGSGFGLMLCRDLISRHGGNLLVESEPGKGSVFTVCMPYRG